MGTSSSLTIRAKRTLSTRVWVFVIRWLTCHRRIWPIWDLTHDLCTSPHQADGVRHQDRRADRGGLAYVGPRRHGRRGADGDGGRACVWADARHHEPARDLRTARYRISAKHLDHRGG